MRGWGRSAAGTRCRHPSLGAEDDLTSAHSGVLTLTPTYTQVAPLLVHGEAVQGTTAHLLGYGGPALNIITIIIIMIMMISSPPALG